MPLVYDEQAGRAKNEYQGKCVSKTQDERDKQVCFRKTICGSVVDNFIVAYILPTGYPQPVGVGVSIFACLIGCFAAG